MGSTHNQLLPPLLGHHRVRHRLQHGAQRDGQVHRREEARRDGAKGTLELLQWGLYEGEVVVDAVRAHATADEVRAQRGGHRGLDVHEPGGGIRHGAAVRGEKRALR